MNKRIIYSFMAMVLTMLYRLCLKERPSDKYLISVANLADECERMAVDERISEKIKSR